MSYERTKYCSLSMVNVFFFYFLGNREERKRKLERHLKMSILVHKLHKQTLLTKVLNYKV